MLYALLRPLPHHPHPPFVTLSPNSPIYCNTVISSKPRQRRHAIHTVAVGAWQYNLPVESDTTFTTTTTIIAPFLNLRTGRDDAFIRRYLDELCSKGLKHVMVPMAGIPPALKAVLSLPKFESLQLYNSHHNAHATAEMGVALLLAAARRVVWLDSTLRTGKCTTVCTVPPPLATNYSFPESRQYPAISSRCDTALNN